MFDHRALGFSRSLSLALVLAFALAMLLPSCSTTDRATSTGTAETSAPPAAASESPRPAAHRPATDTAPPTIPDTTRLPGQVSIDPPAAPGAMAPNLAAGPDGVFATWLEPVAPRTAAQGAAAQRHDQKPVQDSDTLHQLRVARYTGDAWSAPVTIVQSPAIFANWADVGATWRRLGKAHGDGTASEHGFVSLLAGDDGIRAFWLDGRETVQTPATSPGSPSAINNPGSGSRSPRTRAQASIRPSTSTSTAANRHGSAPCACRWHRSPP